MNILKKSTTNISGFTLVEMLVAVSILVSSAIAPMWIAAKGIELSIVAKNRVAAIKLGQEVLEFMRNERDANIKKIVNGVAGVSWHTGFGPGSACDESGVGCTVDVFTKNITACSGTCGALQYLDSGDERIFGHDFDAGLTDSLYTRTVTTYMVPATTDEVRIKVVVDWLDKGSAKSITLEQNLYCWGIENPC